MVNVSNKVFEWRGYISAAVLLPVIILSALSAPWAPQGGWPDVVLDFLAWLMLAAGVFVRLWATLYIGGHKSTELVSGGPYALCRHPLYVASLLIILALTLFLQSITLLAGAVLIALVYAIVIIPSEEQHVRDCFGTAYHDYCRHTPRFFPRWRSFERPGLQEVKVAAFLREFGRTFGFIALGAGADFLAFCRTQPWWPILLRLP